ncbi:uncharacterized protein LOC132186230 [Corylus avellana]|uniref:uncharacterized protein LOC132186229 n=1 Tax=Corylus avellana TaxID=13451 RepID=UPI001E21E7F5|nr:uncharacterized protein LOC132186229 [Corylus avellana]XP_059456072.1 uncharacterized protein LOC132186230 [Corylus avellana]
MNYAIIRSTRIHPPTLFSAPLPYNAGRKACGIGFRKGATMASQQPDNKHKTDKAHNPNEKTGDVMSHSFGEGYSTRSDEEGFGGIYGGNQSIPKPEQDGHVHENHPAYDKSQGSEVKEKEKARHQTNANS